jgi:purine-nucleoside phosphorylase
MWDKVQETVQFIKAKNDFNPEYGVILGSGLGSFTDDMDIAFILPYNEIINFRFLLQGHKGRLFWDHR